MSERINRRPGKPVVGMRVVIYIDPPRAFGGIGPSYDKWHNENANLFSKFVSDADFAARRVKETADKLWGGEFTIMIERDYEEEE